MSVVEVAAWLFIGLCASRFVEALWEVLKKRMENDPY